jgi:hypothetical protein
MGYDSTSWNFDFFDLDFHSVSGFQCSIFGTVEYWSTEKSVDTSAGSGRFHGFSPSRPFLHTSELRNQYNEYATYKHIIHNIRYAYIFILLRGVASGAICNPRIVSNEERSWYGATVAL